MNLKMENEIKAMALEEELTAKEKSVKQFLCDSCRWEAAVTNLDRKAFCKDCAIHAAVDELVRISGEFGVQKLINKVVSGVGQRNGGEKLK